MIKTKSGGYEALVDNRGHRKANHELTELDKANLQIRELKAQLADKELYEAFIKISGTSAQVNKPHRLAYHAIKVVSQGNHGAVTKL